MTILSIHKVERRKTLLSKLVRWLPDGYLAYTISNVSRASKFVLRLRPINLWIYRIECCLKVEKHARVWEFADVSP